MKRIALTLSVALLLTAVGIGPVRAHCEIPCGIYGDLTRIDLLYEHMATVEKSMKQIVELSADPAANANQLARWVMNKEKHCDEIRHIVTQYFLTQRIKPVDAGEEARKKYRNQIETLHRMLIRAMKAKQTTDSAHVTKMREHLQSFSKKYFDQADLRKIQRRHPDGK
jgi:nickel superoxide dismutase